MIADDLLAAVRAAPDDDAPRLVLADHLLERGDPWGEIIQLDCRIAALPRFDRARRVLARRRTQRLADARRAFWKPQREAGLDHAWIRRGLIEDVQLWAFPGEGLAAFPYLPRSVSVAWAGRDAVAPLVASPLAPRLHGLHLLTGERDADAVVRALGDGRGLPALRRLGFRFASPAAWAWLVATPIPRALETLSIQGFADLDALVRHMPGAPLRHLDVWGTPAAGPFAELLRALPDLRRLNLTVTLRDRSGDPTPGAHLAALEALAAARLPALDKLCLRGPREAVPRELLRRVLAAPGLASARELELDMLPLPARDLRLPPRLERLRATEAGVDDAGAAALAVAAPASLAALDLEDNALGDAGVRALLAAPFAASLVELDLVKTRAGDDGARALAAAALPRLRFLSLARCPLGRGGAEALLSGLPDERTIVIPELGLRERDGVIVRTKLKSPRSLTFADWDAPDLAGLGL